MVTPAFLDAVRRALWAQRLRIKDPQLKRLGINSRERGGPRAFDSWRNIAITLTTPFGLPPRDGEVDGLGNACSELEALDGMLAQVASYFRKNLTLCRKCRQGPLDPSHGFADGVLRYTMSFNRRGKNDRL